jgi:hypothetical protein
MFKSIIEFIKEVFKTRSEFYELEQAIASSNPLTTADIEKVEKEFWDKRTRANTFDRYY